MSNSKLSLHVGELNLVAISSGFTDVDCSQTRDSLITRSGYSGDVNGPAAVGKLRYAASHFGQRVGDTPPNSGGHPIQVYGGGIIIAHHGVINY